MSSGMPIMDASATPRRMPKPITRMRMTHTASIGQNTPGTMSNEGCGASATWR